MRRARVALLALGFVAGLAGPAAAQTYNSGSTGADGAVTMPIGSCPGFTCTITLPASGELNYTTVTVDAGWTLKFVPNATNTPVVIRDGNPGMN